MRFELRALLTYRVRSPPSGIAKRVAACSLEASPDGRLSPHATLFAQLTL
jgi:hypothetical protein